MRTRFGGGLNSIIAVFLPTIPNPGSKSAVGLLQVGGSPFLPSSTSLNATGVAGNYTLSGVVTGFGAQQLLGSIDLIDSTNNNALLGTPSLSKQTYALSPAIAFSTGAGPEEVAVGDLNNDGLTDLVVSNAAAGVNTISVLFGDGTGSFSPSATYATGSAPNVIVIGDLNADGIPDLVVSNESSDTVSVLLGNGDGTFQSQTPFNVGTRPFAIAEGDFNGDGILDLAVGNVDDSTLSILLGNGDGSFQPQMIYAAGGEPTSLATADFNGDGVLDLAVTAADGVSILLGVGNGTFQPLVRYATGTNPEGLAVGDFNNDGTPDLAVVNQVGDSLSILLGLGNGTFQPQSTYVVGQAPVGIAVGDFNSDGVPDLATANLNGSSISILLGGGDGTFKSQFELSVGSQPFGLAVGDLNNDGIPDVILPNQTGNQIHELLGQQSALFTISGISPVGPGTHDVFASYSGDSSRQPSQSPAVTLAGTAVVPSIVLASAPNPSPFGTTVTFTAILNGVTGISPTGTVVFEDGTAVLGSATLSGSTATITTHSLAVGAHSITAVYGGDANYSPVTSTAISQTVTKAVAAINLASSSNPATFGNSIVFTATVTSGATGTVTFTSDTDNLGTFPIVAGIASVSTSSLAAGTHNIIATYSGDSNFQ